MITSTPTTPGIEFLADEVGSERVAPEGLTLFGNATTLYGIRSLSGHTFHATTWKEAVTAADPAAFSASPTLSVLRAEESVIASPMLDRLGVRWFAATPAHAPLGRYEDHGLASATCNQPAELDQPLSVTVPGGDGLRGMTIRTCDEADLPEGAAIRVDARLADKTATGQLRVHGAVPAGHEFTIAVPGDDLTGAGELTMTLSLAGAEGRSLALATDPRGMLAFQVVRPVDDGLRLAYADDLRIYERTRSLPRIRWADEAVVITDPQERLRQLASGAIDPGTVVLSEGKLRIPRRTLAGAGTRRSMSQSTLRPPSTSRRTHPTMATSSSRTPFSPTGRRPSTAPRSTSSRLTTPESP